MLFFKMLRSHTVRHKGISIVLLSGVVVCIYCISVMLGLAIGRYWMMTTVNTLGTITVDISGTINVDTDEVLEYSREMSNDRIFNYICFAGEQNGKEIIGWKGVEGETWFPIVNGRFFDNYDMTSSEKICFVSMNFDKNQLKKGYVELAGVKYVIVGTGWILPSSFGRAMPSELYQMDKQGEIIEITDGEKIDNETYYVILPYNKYKVNYETNCILIHFNSTTYSELVDFSKELEKKFDGCKVYPPNENSDTVMDENKRYYGMLATVLCALAGLTVIRLMAEWIGSYKKDIRVLWICGMSKMKCRLLIYGHWLTYFVIGSIVAIIFHYLSFGMLSYFWGDSFPIVQELIRFLIIVFILTVLITYKYVESMFE